MNTTKRKSRNRSLGKENIKPRKETTKELAELYKQSSKAQEHLEDQILKMRTLQSKIVKDLPKELSSSKESMRDILANSRIDMCGMLAEKQQFQVKLQQAKAQMAQIRVDVEANDKLVAELEQLNAAAHQREERIKARKALLKSLVF